MSVFLLGPLVTLGSRWDMRTTSSVSCSQEKDSIPRTKDHFWPGILLHRNIPFSKRRMYIFYLVW